MDTAELNGLIVARGLLDKARLSRDATAPGEITAVILLDLAVETASKAILGTKAKKNTGFVGIIDTLTAEWRVQTGKAEGEIEGTGQVKKLRDYRNGVQHDGNVPSPQNVERYAVYAYDFIDAATQAFFGVALQELSRAHLIANETIRDEIRSAESLASAGDFNTAGEHIVVAFELVVRAVRSDQPWRRRLDLSESKLKRALDEMAPKPPSGVSSLKSKLREILAAVPTKRSLSSFDINKLVDLMLDGPAKVDSARLREALVGIVKELDWLQERMEANAAAGDPAEHAWFRSRLGKGFPTAGGQHWVTTSADPPLAEEEYVRAIEFVTQAALRQQRSAELPAPAWSMRGHLERRQVDASTSASSSEAE
jgi:hypothetical protein